MSVQFLDIKLTGIKERGVPLLRRPLCISAISFGARDRLPVGSGTTLEGLDAFARMQIDEASWPIDCIALHSVDLDPIRVESYRTKAADPKPAPAPVSGLGVVLIPVHFPG